MCMKKLKNLGVLRKDQGSLRHIKRQEKTWILGQEKSQDLSHDRSKFGS